MLEYLKTFYVQMAFGPSYIPTELLFVTGIVLTFDKLRWNKKAVGNILGKVLFTWLFVNFLIFSHSKSHYSL